MPFLPYQDAMMGRPWTVNCQVNPVSSMTTTGIPLAGPYRSGMMDYRETEGHKDWLRQQDAAFNSPTGLNSHREMYFGEPVATGHFRREVSHVLPEPKPLPFLQTEPNYLASLPEPEIKKISLGPTILQTEPNYLASLPEPEIKKISWGPTIDHGNGLWEKHNESRDETLIGYKPYGTHTHIGSDFISIKNEETGQHLRWGRIKPL